MARQVVIVGGGEVGTYLASLLLAGGHQGTVVERQGEDIARLQRELSTAMVMAGNGTDPAVLEAAGIRQAHVVAAVTGTDETNLVVTSLARFGFQVPRTMARVHTPKHAWMFTPAMGVDVALNQHPRAAAVGTALRDLPLPSECALAAIIRGGQLLIPRADLVLQPADEVLAVVHASQAAHLAALLGRPA